MTRERQGPLRLYFLEMSLRRKLTVQCFFLQMRYLHHQGVGYPLGVLKKFTKNKKGNSDSKKITVHDQLNVYFSFHERQFHHYYENLDLRGKKLAISRFTKNKKGRSQVTKIPFTTLYTGRLRPQVQPFTPLYTIFGRKGSPFCIPSIDKWYPCRIPSLELCIPFNCS